MKHILYINNVMAFAVLLAFLATGSVAAKRVAVPKMYMFGFAASFTDSIVHFTDVMEVDSTWADKKSKFLLGREQYSAQLRDYLNNEQQMPHRTCIVFYNAKRAKVEKQFLKMKRLYGPDKKDGKMHFDVRYVESPAFQFKAAELAPDEEEMVRQPKAKAKVKFNPVGAAVDMGVEAAQEAIKESTDKAKRKAERKFREKEQKAAEKRRKAGEEIMQQKMSQE